MKKNNNLIYLNTAAVGLVSPDSIQAAQHFQNKTQTNPFSAFMEWSQNGLVNLRAKMAQLLHTESTQVAFVPNFSYGLQAVLDTLRPKVERILLYKNDYPSVNMPVELGGFKVSYVESKNDFIISVEDIIAVAKKEKPEAIVISHVQFLTGFTLEIEKLGAFCQENNIVFILDATQSLGAMEIDFEKLPIDVLIASSYKWLNGGLGSAVLAIKESFMENFPPRLAGFGSMDKSPTGWSYKPSLISYEPGHLNPLGLIQLEKAVEQRLETGVKTVEKHNYSLIQLLTEGLETTSFDFFGKGQTEYLSSILVIKAEQKIQEYLTENNIFTTWRKGSIRVSPHFYNTKEEIEVFIDVLKKVVI